jgi:pimeloyl-ACP methyl ester carboxylesterase
MNWLRSSLVVGAFVASFAATQVLPPPPGQLVGIGGGRRLHLLCSGQGAPTVLLEAGGSAFAIDWILVQRDIEKTNRVCSYDRAGIGWSDPLPPETDATDTPDLHALVTAAKVPRPFVLVGASRGGILIRHYLLDHPGDVIGLVFVDPASEDRLFAMVGNQAMAIAEMTPDQIRSTLPFYPVKVQRRAVQRGAPFDRLPPELYQQRLLLDERLVASGPETVTREQQFRVQEYERAMLARLLATRKGPLPFGDRPTVVLTRGDERHADRERVHADLAKLSSRSRHAVIAGAGHEIHLFDPAAVAAAIREVLGQLAR